MFPSCAATKVFSHHREGRTCPGSSGLWWPESSRLERSSPGRFTRRFSGAPSNARRLQANRIFGLCRLVTRSDRHCAPARVLVRAYIRRCLSLFSDGLVGSNTRHAARDALASEPSRLTFLFRHLVMDGIARALDVRDPTIGFGAGLLFGRHFKGVRQ
jgi:hypothetical protein